MKLGNLAGGKAVGFRPEIPRAFDSLEEARNSLDYHWNGCIHLFHKVRDQSESRPRLEEDRRHYLELFQRWLRAFQMFLENSSNILDTKSLQGARVLQFSQAFAMANIDASPVAHQLSETVWDKYKPYYEHMVSLGQEVIDLAAPEDHVQSKGPPNFCLDMNIVGPLYAVAHKCRDPVIRRKAVSLLYAAPRQEGIWDSVAAARVAERLISIEEEGLGPITSCKDVPDAARISSVDVKFDFHGRLRKVKYSRERNCGDKKREDFEETIKW